jgi:HAE1 family hydrophobic/amphiphilic exporter-1
MARAFVGGLVFSTVVTLLVLPTIYVLMDDLRNWARGLSGERRKTSVSMLTMPRSNRGIAF